MTDPEVTIQPLSKMTLGQIGKCGQCKFSDVFRGPNGQVDLSQRACKFEPPKLFVMPVGNQMTIQSFYPTVPANERGCSKFSGTLNS